MKKTVKLIAPFIAAVLLFCCWGCSKKEAKKVDLTEFYNTLSETYDFGSMTDVEGELLDSYYPGMSQLTLKQSIIKMPMITASASEIALVEANNADDAKKVAEILEARKKSQADGGAWYPASVEQWGKAEVITKGNYVMLIAHENSSEIADSFRALFE